MNAEIVYLYAYDIAQEADLSAIEASMRGETERFDLGRLKDAPRDFPVFRPVSVQINAMTAEGPHGALRLLPSIKIFTVGAISIKVRVPVTVERLADLADYRDLVLGDGTTLAQKAHELGRRSLERIRAHLDTPVQALAQPEGYTVFCLEAPVGAGEDAGAWLTRNEREVAALLVGEADPGRLSRQEVGETIQYRYSYYEHDLAVIDWDAALLVDVPKDYNDTLYVLELANLQLEELRAYDQQLDSVLDKAYGEMARAARPYVLGARQRVLNGLRGIMMDMAKVADEIGNITKFFGDWHLARVYMGCAERFHLAEWEQTVSRKLRALDGLYTMLLHESGNRVMLWLETAIVALFVIDLIIIILLGKA
jgi:hypothetical protein